MPPEIVPARDGVTALPCDAIVVGARTSDEGFVLEGPGCALDDALEGQLGEALRDGGFKGKPGDVAIVPTLGRLPARTIAVAGLGSAPGAAEVRRAAAAAARRLSERHALACALHHDVEGAGAAAAEGFLLGSYRFAGYRSEPRTTKIERVLMIDADRAAVERGTIVGEAVVFARDLTNEPADVLTPTALADRARRAADVAGIECSVLGPDALAEGGYGGILAVAKGSAEPPALIRLHYRPGGGGAPRLALVGKGVTYDSGGLSIKPAQSLEQMKTDMGGAAAVVAAVSAAARLDVAAEVVAYVPATENMIGPAAMRPGDVIRHYGGRTTEMVNADAEGRLILADALARAAEDDPEAVVDIATLTGHVAVALGRKIGGLFATEDGLADEILAAASRGGERLWRLPLPDDYMSDLESDVADAKNSGARYGGGLVAALFLKAFVPPRLPWGHLDIAGPGRAESDFDEGPKGGTGFGTRTLISWLESRGR